MERKPFKKGEHVIAISLTSRDPHIPMVITGMGPKFITCQPEDMIHNPFTIGIKFENKEPFYRADWRSYRLLHSVEEYQQELDELELRKKFDHDAACCSNFFTIEEIKQFYAIHEQNINAVM